MPLWLGRRCRFGISRIVLSTSESSILSGSPWRVAVVFGPPQSGIVTLYPRPAGTLFEGVTLYPDSPPWELSIYSHGDLVTRGWFAIWADVVNLAHDKPTATWSLFANAVGASATATRAAESGNRHVVTHASTSFDSTVPVGSSFILDGAAILNALNFTTAFSFVITHPIGVTRGNSAGVSCQGAPAGVTATANVAGYTVGPGIMAIYETILEGG